MLSFIIDLLKNPLDLPINVVVQFAILSSIWLILFPIAWNLVGNMYHKGTISGRAEGSGFHWLFRIILFVLSWAAIRFIGKVYMFVIANWQVVLVFGVSVLVAAIICFAAIIIMRKIKSVAAK